MSDSIVYLDRPGVLVMPGGREKLGGTRIPILAGRIVNEALVIDYPNSTNYEFSLVLSQGTGSPIMCSEEPTKLLVMDLNGIELNETSRVADLSSIQRWSLDVENIDMVVMRLNVLSLRQPETYSSYLQRRLKE